MKALRVVQRLPCPYFYCVTVRVEYPNLIAAKVESLAASGCKLPARLVQIGDLDGEGGIGRINCGSHGFALNQM